jgi:hypothetical protein
MRRLGLNRSVERTSEIVDGLLVVANQNITGWLCRSGRNNELGSSLDYAFWENPVSHLECGGQRRGSVTAAGLAGPYQWT